MKSSTNTTTPAASTSNVNNSRLTAPPPQQLELTMSGATNSSSNSSSTNCSALSARHNHVDDDVTSRRCTNSCSPKPSSSAGSTPAMPTTTTHRSTPSPLMSTPQPTTSNNKIVSRNVNGTMTVTSSPNNEAELQLYRVMQRASLLSYYDTLLEMGGDDVQQLCDAGEEEFLEIMALIGMASKPLHVRRLQKALQEWMTNPALFQLPLISINYADFSQFPSTTNFSQQRQLQLFQQTTVSPIATSMRGSDCASPNDNKNSLVNSCSSPVLSEFGNTHNSPSLVSSSYQITSKTVNIRSNSPSDISTGNAASSVASSSGPSPCSPLSVSPVLSDAQISHLAEGAERLSRLLPRIEPKPPSAKKKANKDLEQVMLMSEDNPRRMEEIRRYAAIYGRFDCKRRAEKPLTAHEICVNEAAAQICRFVPALLSRRDELFPLARQLVRDCSAADLSRHARTNIHMSPTRTRSGSTNSSDSEATSSGGGAGSDVGLSNSTTTQMKPESESTTKPRSCSAESSPGR